MKLHDGVVLSDDLLKEFLAFESGDEQNYKISTIKKILKYHFNDGILRSLRQYDALGIEPSPGLKKQLVDNQLTKLSNEELAKKTIYKVVLCTDRNDFPYVNITPQKEKIGVAMTGSFTLHESRAKAKAHIKALCAEADEIVLFDKYMSERHNKEQLKSLLTAILPNKKVVIKYDTLEQDIMSHLRNRNPLITFERVSLADKDAYHDRYLIIDKEVEVIISSGFDHLASDVSDMTYVIQPYKKTLQLR